MIGMQTRVLVLMLVGVAAYWNGLSAPFILDDDTSIVTNASIETLALPGPLLTPSETPVARRPLVNLSFAVTYALWERSVFWYHAGNLLIHLLAALALFGVVRRTLRLPPLRETFGPGATSVAWACTLIWLVHPLNSEIVDYVTQRSEGMLGLFYLLALYCAIRSGAEHGRRWTIATVACCAAGTLCKESMVTAPLLVLLYDRMFLFDSWKALAARRVRLYAGLAASWILLAVVIRSADRTSAGFDASAPWLGGAVSSWDYLLNQARIIPHYLLLVVWPVDQVVDYGNTRPISWSSVIVPGVLLVIAASVVLVGLIRRPRMAFPGAWFFITLAPTSSLVPIATEVAAERRMYLPLAGLVAFAVVSAYWLARRHRWSRTTLPVACGVVVVLLGISTISRNSEYADPVRLAETVVDRWPSGRAYATLGMLYSDRGEHAAAVREFRKSADLYPPGHYPLGVALVESQQVEEGLEHLRTFIRLAPGHNAVTGARDLIGRILVDRGDLEGASREFELLIADDHVNARAMVLLAEVRLRQNRVDEAIALFMRARGLDAGVGRDGAMMARYGLALATVNRMPEAERVFAEAAAMNPQDATLQKLWGRSLAAGGRFAAAAERFQRARTLAPDDPETRELVDAIERRVGLARGKSPLGDTLALSARVSRQ
jgi:protein O-mannosyl-transferase